MRATAVQPPVFGHAPVLGGFPAAPHQDHDRLLGQAGMKRILVVDDNAEIRHLLNLVLGRFFQVFEAEDGVHALELASELKPDAVVLDVMMPGELDGLDVLTRIKGDPELRQAYVAMVTARGQAADKAAAEQLGADAYFVKPFSPLELASQIRQQLA